MTTSTKTYQPTFIPAPRVTRATPGTTPNPLPGRIDPRFLAPASQLTIVSSTRKDGVITNIMAVSKRGKSSQTLHLTRRADGLYYTAPTGIAQRRYVYRLEGSTLTRAGEETTRPAQPDRSSLRGNRFMRALRRLALIAGLLRQLAARPDPYHFPAKTCATITRDLTLYAQTGGWKYIPQIGETGEIKSRDGSGAWIEFVSGSHKIASYIPNQYFRTVEQATPAPAQPVTQQAVMA